MEKFEIQGGKDKVTIKETSKTLERMEKWGSKGYKDKKPNDSNKGRITKASKEKQRTPTRKRKTQTSREIRMMGN